MLYTSVGVAEGGSSSLGELTRAEGRSVGIHLLAGLEGHGVIILSDVLSPLDVALVVVQHEADSTALQLFFCDLGTFCICCGRQLCQIEVVGQESFCSLSRVTANTV